MDDIPTADISAFTSNDCSAQDRKAAAQHLAAALRVHGCAGITGHGLPETSLKDVFATMRKFFELPLSDKMKAPHGDGPIPHRGYLAKAVERSGKLGVVHSNSETEKAFLADAVDWKETYDIGHEDNRVQANVWLPNDVLPGFRPLMVETHTKMSKISMAILDALMLGMESKEEELQDLRRMHTPVEHQLRLAHYLPMSPEHQRDPNKIRLAPHKDFSSYTLLFQESGSGLEFQNRETGEYMPAKPKEGVLYLNIGDLFQRYSNGFYPSAMHRVATPTTKGEDGTIPGRLSIPFFVGVGLDDEIFPLPSRVDRDGEKKFEAIKYSELAHDLFEPVIPGKAQEAK